MMEHLFFGALGFVCMVVGGIICGFGVWMFTVVIGKVLS